MSLCSVIICCYDHEDSSTYETSSDYARSQVLSANSVDYSKLGINIKSMFASLDIPKMRVPSNHTHGESATRRSEASRFMDRLGDATGRRLVQYQGSSADERNERVSTRTWHWAKDTQVAPKSVVRDENDLLAMVDVDYYINMPKFLANFVQPTILYTLQPSSVARCSGDYKYTFTHGDVINYYVSGGGNYEHQIWNYVGDSFTTTKKFCGIPYKYVCYNIERKRVDDDHQLVLLTPLRSFGWKHAWLAARQLGERPLQRLKICEGDFLRLAANTSDGMVVHTGQVNSFLACTVPSYVDDQIRCATLTSSVSLPLSVVKTKLDKAKVPADNAEILQLYHRCKTGKGKPDIVANVSDGVRGYQYVSKLSEFDHEVDNSMVAFMKPLFHGAFVPQDCLNNDRRCIKERVTKIASNVTLGERPRRYAKEFVRLLNKHGVKDLRLVDLDVVWEKQNRPTQRHILEAADHDSSKPTTASFMKKEAYQQVTDPRNISTINGVDKRDYSQITYALSDAIKRFEWYAFGKTPIEVARRVARTVSIGHWALLTDFSRMDGRISEAVREFELMLLKGVFHKDDICHIQKVWETQHGLKGKTKHGVSYLTGMSRLSGSPETSIMNTLLSIFIMYMSYRSTNHNGRCLTPDQAFAMLGIAGGDDGLCVDLLEAVMKARAADMGQLLTCERIERGDFGVQFLSRVYGPNIWYAESDEDVSSVADIRRVLAKFHVTVRLTNNCTPAQKLFDKAYALALTDSNTPIIGPFVKKVLELYPRYSFKNCMNIWNVVEDEALQYPNSSVDWAQQLVDRDLPEFDFERFGKWLANLTTCTVFDAPAFHPPAPVKAKPGIVVVDDDVVVSPEVELPEIPQKIVSKGKRVRGGRRRKSLDKRPPTYAVKAA